MLLCRYTLRFRLTGHRTRLRPGIMLGRLNTSRISLFRISDVTLVVGRLDVRGNRPCEAHCNSARLAFTVLYWRVSRSRHSSLRSQLRIQQIVSGRRVVPVAVNALRERFRPTRENEKGNTMSQLLNALYNDEAGFVVSAELILIATVAVLSLVVGLGEVSHAVNQ